MNSSVLFMLFVSIVGFAQTRPAIRGRVVSYNTGIKDVLVINNNAQAETRTDSLGYFTIKANTGDLFVISDYKVETKKIRYTPDQVTNSIFTINVTPAATELDEVVITRDNSITAEGLGLVPKNQVRYTVAERRLRAEFSGSFNLDSFMAIHEANEGNSLSGNMKFLFQNVLTERKLNLVEEIKMLYDDDEILSRFKIQPDETEAFLYYISENKDLAEAVRAKNKNMVTFLINGLATRFNTLKYEK